ncbi:hypothetical protein AB0M43_20415 [Longispora sp. NPDC051575]|uniref:hypothetical protein n=1 Tax=Longispora sp. NPDC051575 TaxID=3154943 RepID=UPI00342A907C
MDQHALEVMDLRYAVLESPGATDPAVRDAAHYDIRLPELWAAYVARVREESYQMTDLDVEDLLAAGCTEDAIFEMTLAAAVGAATQRLDAGLRAVREAD